jgi:large subunit ribosomal protein L7/L12
MAKLRIIHPGTFKIQIVKLVHTYSKLGLKESKDKVDNFPSEFNIDKEYLDFEKIEKDFKISGATVTIVDSVNYNSQQNENKVPFLTIKLINPGYNKIEIIKLIKIYTNLSLKESKDLAENVPSIFKIEKTVPDFESIRKIFSDAGAIIEELPQNQILKDREKEIQKPAKLKVKLISPGQHSLEVVKLIRLFSGLSLYDSKQILDGSLENFIIEDPEMNFEQVRKNFESIGAVVEVFNDNKTPETNQFEEKLDSKVSSKPHEAHDTKN